MHALKKKKRKRESGHRNEKSERSSSERRSGKRRINDNQIVSREETVGTVGTDVGRIVTSFEISCDFRIDEVGIDPSNERTR